MMNILIVGASRGIGRALVEQALATGNSVTALARHPERLAAQHERPTLTGRSCGRAS